MQKFRQHLTQLLVATDVAARGLDVDDLTHVINFGMPDDIESYTHRSGRTGRAGTKGTSIAIVHTREKHKIREVEKTIGKQFVAGVIPSPQEICTKQLYKVMDEIVKVDVDDEQIAPFMTEINRHFEYFDKEDVIKKIVAREFGRFIAYYANAPELSPIEKKEKGKKQDSKGKKQGSSKPQEGYRKLFINLGKADGFYPGEIMQYLNKYVKGRQEVGHIDLLNKFCYIEVPEEDANKVMKALNGTVYKGREVRCNDSDTPKPSSKGEGGRKRGGQGRRDDDFRGSEKQTGRRGKRKAEADNFQNPQHKFKKEDWMQFLNPKGMKLKGEEPDFSEEGWARRRPKKK